jgi:hypothetical protein
MANCVRITELPTMEPTVKQPSTISRHPSKPRPSRSTPTPTLHQPIYMNTKLPRSFSPTNNPAAAPSTVSSPDSKDSATTTAKCTVGTVVMQMVAAVVAVVEFIDLM